MRRTTWIALVLLSLTAVALPAPSTGPATAPGPDGRLTLTLQRRVADEKGAYHIRQEKVAWEAGKTAAIVCDMWDQHWCQGATQRVGEMAGRMNELLAAARSKGVLIIHAPSSTMGHYAATPARKRAQAAPRAADLPAGIADWAGKLPAENAAVWPLDQSDGGCDCQPTCKQGSPWRKQVEAIEVRAADAASDSGEEVWNLLAQRGIENVLVMGVHTNMCVIGRPFGLRNLVRCGKRVVLVRDLTDTMYNSRKAPFVSHFRGTELMVEYIERHVCPTALSCDVLGGGPVRFRQDARPRAVFAVSEPEYSTADTLSDFAERVLGDRCGLRPELLLGDPADANTIPGLAEALGGANLLFISMRRRAMPEADLAAVRKYLDAGRPILGIRTASHAFDTKGKHPAGRGEWPEFDAQVLGGNYKGHHGPGTTTTVTAAAGAEAHAILAGVSLPMVGNGSLYRVSPLAAGTTPLLMGAIPGKPAEPVAWTNLCGKSRVFYTSLGHPADFAGKDPPLVRLLTNAVFWAMDKPVPTTSSK
jgi:nicotinamidase-related amidase/type 1 glutamine amidotransferase